jgi:hypothetical protein
MLSQSQIGDNMKVARRHNHFAESGSVHKRAQVTLAQDSDRGRNIVSPARTLQALVEKSTWDRKWPGSARVAAIVGLSVALWAVLIVGVVQITKHLV